MTLVTPIFTYIFFAFLIFYSVYGIYTVLKFSSSENGLAKVLWMFLIIVFPIIGSKIAIFNYNYKFLKF